MFTKRPKPVSRTIGGKASLKGLGKQVVFEAAKQAGKGAEEGVEEIFGGGGKNSSGAPAPAKSTSGSNSLEEQKEIERLQNEVKRTGPRRDVEKEIKEVREKKKEDEEEKFLQELQEQRKKEEEEAKKDAADAVVEPVSSRPKRGSAFAVGRKRRKTEARMGKN